MSSNSHSPGTCWRPATLAVLALLLSACTLGPDFVPPAAPAATRYTSKAPSQAAAAAAAQRVVPGNKVTSEWWKEFHSAALDDAVAEAIKDNRTLAATRATLAQAEEAVNAAAAALYPQVDLPATAGAQKFGAAQLGTTAVPPTFGFLTVGPMVSYALDIFGGTKRRIEGQAALAQYQGYQLAAARLTLSGRVVLQALAVASARAQTKAVEDILADDEKNLSLVQTARAAGAVSDVDVLSAESQLANDRTLLPPLNQQLSAARHALAVLVGKAPSEWTPPDFELGRLALPAELPLSLPSELVHERPDIMAAEAQLHAASAGIGVATANLYPQITLDAALGQQALDPGHLFGPASTAWNIGGGLAAPLFHGGALEAERRAAIAAYEAALADYEETVLQSFAQVADTLRALEHDAEELAAQKHAFDSAEASLRLTRISYSAGNSGILQVLDAERLDQQARLGYVRADVQRYVDTAGLYLALGGAALSAPAAAAK